MLVLVVEWLDKGLLQLPQAFWRVLRKPSIQSPILVRYRQPLSGRPGNKKWLSGTFLVLTDQINNWDFADVLIDKNVKKYYCYTIFRWASYGNFLTINFPKIWDFRNASVWLLLNRLLLTHELMGTKTNHISKIKTRSNLFVKYVSNLETWDIILEFQRIGLVLLQNIQNKLSLHVENVQLAVIFDLRIILKFYLMNWSFVLIS